METIQSRYLKRDFSFTPATMQRNDGPVTIIPHNVLWDIIHNQITDKEIICSYNPVAVTKEHCFIGCTMQDTAGRSVTEFGESTTETLTSNISKGIPATMAQIRAFDRAAIRYLDFDCDGKVYSDQEIPSSEYTSPVPQSEPPKETATKPETPSTPPEPEAPADETPATVPEPESASEPEPVVQPPEHPAAPPDGELEKAPPTWQNGNVKKAVLDAFSENSEIIVFDTETSGLQYKKDDRILEIAAKKYAIKDGLLGAMTDELHTYIKPPFSINPDITAINGISDELLADKPVEEDAFVDIFSFFGEKPALIAAHNTPFDVNFMTALYKRQEKSFAPVCKLDTLDMARDLLKELKSHKLENVAEHYGIEPGKFHSANVDTYCAAELLRRFVEEYTNNAAAPADGTTSGKDKPNITSITLFDKSATLRRIYVNTDKGTLFYDLVKKSWASKDAKMDTIDMDYLEKEAWKCAGVKDQAAFEQFKGNWAAA